MAKFHGFCCPFPPLVLLIEGVGGMGVERHGEKRVGWEVAKNPFGTPHEQP